MKRLIVSAIGLYSGVLLAGAGFVVQIKPTANEQWTYASELRSRVTRVVPGDDRYAAAKQAAMAFEQIAVRWPNDRRATVAYAAAAKLLFEEDLIPDAEQMCEEGLAIASGNDPLQRQLAAIRGSALLRLDKSDDAEAAFAVALRPGLASADDFTQLYVWNRAAAFASARKQHGRAAEYLRSASQVGSNDVQRIGYLIRAVEADENASDVDAAKQDLQRLDVLVQHARGSQLTAADAMSLNRLVSEIERHRKKVNG